MLKNNKGITLISLTITIIVLLILSSVTIYTSIELIQSSKIRNYITKLTLIKVEVEKTFEDFEFENDVKDMNAEGLDTSKLEITGTEKINLSGGERFPMESNFSINEKKLILENIEYAKDPNSDGIQDVDVDNLWYKWTTSTLNELKIDYSDMMSDEEYFIINYATGEIIFSKEIEKNSSNGKIYSLTGLKELD